MASTRPGLVDIAREFLVAHLAMRRLFARHRDATLRFEELAELIGDDEKSVLFRLKERCHLAFRSSADGSLPLHREALFDLAVGSLFHEAMKFRENFYQREVYGPRVEALRSDAGAAESALFDEFARIQEGVSANLEEGLGEMRTLLARMADQLLSLLAAHREDPLVARFLVESAAEVEEAVERPLDAVLETVYGDAATGYAEAGRSLLRSGYYPESILALEAAAAHGAESTSTEAFIAYARGMRAYLDQDYGETVSRLSEWVSTRSAETAADLSALARDVVGRIGQLATGDDRERIVGEAAALLSRMAGRPA